MVRLGYSTYAMRELDVFDALPRLRLLGYEAMEICVRDGWATAAEVFGASARRRLVGPGYGPWSLGFARTIEPRVPE